MRVTSTSTLLWLVHLSVLYTANGAESEEVYKPRRWTAAAGDGPYRLVVSSEWETLDGEESVSLAVAQEKKKKEKEATDLDKVTQRAMGKQRGAGRKPEQRKRWRSPTSTGPPQTMSYNLYNHFRPLEQDLPSESLIPFLDFGRKLSTNSIESSSTPRGEEVKSTLRTRLHPVNRTRLVPQNKTETTNVHYDLQSNESGINLHAVLSPDYGLKLNKTSDENSTQNAIIINESKTVSSDNTTSSEVTEKSSTEIADIKSDKPKNSSTTLTKGKTNDALSTETAVPVPSPKPTARILSTAVVTSVSVKESPWAPRIKTNLTRPEAYQRLAWKNLSTDSAPLHYSPESRIRSDNYTLIMQQQNLRRKMYTTYRPKTTTYRPVTFRNVFRRNFTGLGTGVVHILSTPPTYIEVPKILANAPAKIVSSEALLSTIGTPEFVEPVFSNVTVKPDPLPSLATLEPTIATRSTKVYSTFALPTTQASTTTSNKPTTPSTTQSTTTPSTTTSTEGTTTVSTTSSTPPSSSTMESTTTTMPTSSTTVSTTSTTAEPTTTPEPTTLSTTTTTTSTTTEQSTTNRPIQTSISYSLSSSVTQPTVTLPEITQTSHIVPVSENASVEIEFKPLDSVNTTRRPNLLWLYNQRNHSLGNNPPVTYPESHIGLVSYVLAGLALIPLILGLSVLARQIFKKSKKKVLDESEYSSEYNRTPLPTKLPRVPAHINWEGEKQPTLATAPPVPVTKWEFSRDKLRLQTVLGQGNFGQVWKAEADDLSGHEGSTRLVAVKTVKEGSSPREKEDLLRELGIMQELGAHPNVVTLLGCCTEKEPYLLIMEYVMYGKLLAFLREHRTRAHYFNFSDLSSALTSRDLTFFSYCVARGMEYLVTKGIIHRDLAARNILVDHTKLCKIADFGMSRNVRDTGQIYEQKPNRGALPIRWMAPESLHLSLFTHKSDVWSFGILLWEIITLGSTPYSKMGAREVMREVREGYRLDKPKHCRPELYRVAAKCWQSDPGKRPSFSELKQDLANLLADEQTNGEYVDLEALTEEMADQPT